MINLPAWAVRYLLEFFYLDGGDIKASNDPDLLDAVATIELNMANQLREELEELES